MKQQLNNYLSLLKSYNYSIARLQQVEKVISKLICYVKESLGKTNWVEVTARDLESFLECWKNIPKKDTNEPRQKVENYCVSCIKVFFLYLQKQQIRLDNPTLDLPLQRKDLGKNRALSEQQIKQLMQLPNTETEVGLRNRALIELLYATAIRVSEAANLNLSDVDTLNQQIWIRKGKGSRDRLIPLTENASYWIDQYLLLSRPILAMQNKLSSQALWLSSVKGTRLYKSTFTQLVSDYAKQLGIKASGHILRHSCATHLLWHGANIRHVQKLLGHNCLAATARYTHARLIDLRNISSTLELNDE